jgi:hypothetical protein
MRYLLNCIYFIVIFSSISFKTHAANIIELPLDEDSEKTFALKSWHLSLGNYFDLPSTYQVTSTGQKNNFELWPIVNWGRTYQGYFYQSFLFQWNILFSVPKDVGTSDLTRTLIAFDFMVGNRINYFGSIYAGISFFQQLLFYKESGVVQTEGTSDSGKFQRPSRAVLVSQQALILSYVTPKYFDHLSLEAKSYIFSLWDSKERAESYAFNVLYQW